MSSPQIISQTNVELTATAPVKRVRKSNRSKEEIAAEKTAIAERKAAREAAKTAKAEEKAAKRTRKPNRSQEEIAEEKAAIAERKAARVTAKTTKAEEKAAKRTRKQNRPKEVVDAEKAAKLERKQEREQKREQKAAKPKIVDAEGNEIKKNLTAYFLFQNSKRAEVKALLAEEGDGKVKIGDIAKTIGAMWKECSDEDKAQLAQQAAEDKKRYETEVAANPEKKAAAKAAKKAAKEAEVAAKSGIDAQEPIDEEEQIVEDDLTVQVNEFLADEATEKTQKELTALVKAAEKVQPPSPLPSIESWVGKSIVTLPENKISNEGRADSQSPKVVKKRAPRRSKEVIEAEKAAKAERKADKKTKLVVVA